MNKQAFIVAIALASASVSSHAQQPNVFIDVLNRCLSTPDADITACARIAGSVSGSASVWVSQKFDFAPGAGQPGSTGTTEIGECFDEGSVCQVLDCQEDDQTNQSTCTLVGMCTTNSDESACYYD